MYFKQYPYLSIAFCLMSATLFQLLVTEDKTPKHLCCILATVGSCLTTKGFIKLTLVCAAIPVTNRIQNINCTSIK